MKNIKKKPPLENTFKKTVKGELDKLPNCYYFIKEARGIRGIPDIIGCINGTFFAWELKRSSQEADKTSGRIALQRHNLHKIQMVKGVGRLVHPDNLEECLQELLDLS